MCGGGSGVCGGAGGGTVSGGGGVNGMLICFIPISLPDQRIAVCVFKTRRPTSN
jgi:hypothetical protein